MRVWYVCQCEFVHGRWLDVEFFEVIDDSNEYLVANDACAFAERRVEKYGLRYRVMRLVQGEDVVWPLSETEK